MRTIAQGKTDLATQAQQLSVGVAKHLASATQVTFTGGTYTPVQMTSTLQSIVTLRAGVVAAQATARAKVAAEQAQTPSLRAFTRALVTHVEATYGDSPEVLADFGITPKARAQTTVETKAAAVAKGAATRAARHTMGPQQKKAVKGDVTGITLTPITAASPLVTTPGSATAGATAPAAPAAPAPHATS